MKPLAKSLALPAISALVLAKGANAQSGEELLKAKGCLGRPATEKNASEAEVKAAAETVLSETT